MFIAEILLVGFYFEKKVHKHVLYALGVTASITDKAKTLVKHLGYIYIRAKAKATSLQNCCIVSNMCVYTTAMCERQKIKENYRFRSRSNIKEPLYL